MHTKIKKGQYVRRIHRIVLFIKNVISNASCAVYGLLSPISSILVKHITYRRTYLVCNIHSGTIITTTYKAIKILYRELTVVIACMCVVFVVSPLPRKGTSMDSMQHTYNIRLLRVITDVMYLQCMPTYSMVHRK